ncbi:MAG: NADH-quinone oxidoreductase subunit L [Isosphaeraceae bacterium]|nr:NADH-quinone oxidoreductase subunit L [Isosphaeraceae bacterium]
MSTFFVQNAWLLPALPLIGGLTAAVGGRALGRHAHIPVVAGIAGAFVVSLFLLFGSGGETQPIPLEWLEVSGLSVPLEFRVDGLTTMMLSMVTFVATLVAVFASGYMAGDPGYARFFAVVGLFVFSMTGLVLSSNYLLTYAFWEGVGVCSYLLIGFWYAKPSAAAAAKKAFLVNRIGDFGFAVAIFWLWTVSDNHDLSYDVVLGAGTLGRMTHADIVGISLLLFWAATAKSAQIPLYVWLPDAMEGPTPVSALIHAATMVTAGVYLVARSTPLIVMAPEVQLVVCIVGCATALLAGLIALTQTDLKRVLAYSTVSQIGFMFMALGSGVGKLASFAVIAGMFHLFTHAFFKALLFLGSGSVMHAMGHVIDMRRFRGLRHRMPITCWTFAVGGLALSGVVPLAGFWSKDEVLVSLHLAGEVSNEANGTGWGGVYHAIYWVAVFTALLTAFYTGRAFFKTFFGPEKLPSADDPEAEPGEHIGHADHADDGHADHEHADHGHVHATSDAGHHDSHFGHESPPVMTYPLIVLAVCSVLVGLVFGPTHLFMGHVEHTPGLHPPEDFHHEFEWMTPIVGSLAALIGLVASWFLYSGTSTLPDTLSKRLGALYRASLGKFYVDEIYAAIVVGPTKFLAAACEFFDVVVVDNLVRLVAWIPRAFGRNVLGPMENGLIQFYAAVTAIGIASLLFILLLLS